MDAKLQKVMYSFGYESKARALNGFGDMFNLPDFEERRAKLVAGLDKGSVDVVNRILRRLKIILKLKEGEKVDLYTKEEQEAFVESKHQLQDKIVQLAPDLFIWNGYALPQRHFEPNVFLGGYGFEFIETLGDIGDKAIIDAGAFIGDSALMLAPLTTGKVFAFEPMEDTFRLLEKTVFLNGLVNVIPVHSALGDSIGTLTMTVGNAGACATMQNRLPDENQRQETIVVAKLDDFVRKQGVSVGLIKTDVEGAEQMLLRGARETIERDRPILLVSIYHNASDFLDIKPMIESWNLGYHFHIYHPPIKSISGETVLIAECGHARKTTLPAVPELMTTIRQILRASEARIRGLEAARGDDNVSALRIRLDQKQQAVIKREEWLAVEKAKVAKRDEHVAALKAQLEQKQRAVVQRDEWLAAEKLKVAKRDERVSALKAQLEQKQHAVAERDGWLVNEKAKVAKRDERVSVLKAQLERREQAVAERDGWLAAEKAKVTKRDERVAALKAQLEQRAQAVAKRDELLASEKEKVKSARSAMSRQEARIKTLESTIRELRQVVEGN